MFSARQLREIFHFCFLENLLRIADAKQFVLKGGVNLRFFFRSPRYSEDMDVDVLAGGVATLKKNGYRVLGDPTFRRTLRTYGIADIAINDPDKARHTQTTQRFRVQLITASGEKLPGKVEFSRRAGAGLARVVEPIDPEVARQYHRLGFLCQHYSGEAAAVQKVLALAGRSVTQARDVFDLDILLRGGHAHLPILEAVSARDRAVACQNLESLDFAAYSGQVLEFLDEEHRASYGNRPAWNAMVNRVRELLDSS
ncbi:MAG: nucleotidyl transferase AbiEii/AbiGii toxin family protein [Steroidobacteraceae bacterium]|jgi:predicted nucleotidyltransferase component of viral defense system